MTHVMCYSHCLGCLELKEGIAALDKHPRLLLLNVRVTIPVKCQVSTSLIFKSAKLQHLSKHTFFLIISTKALKIESISTETGFFSLSLRISRQKQKPERMDMAEGRNL